MNRRLENTSARLKAARAKLAVAEEQLGALEDEASNHELRALVSETPDAAYEFRQAAAHVAAMRRHRDDLLAEVSELMLRQDELLDKLSAARGSTGF